MIRPVERMKLVLAFTLLMVMAWLVAPGIGHAQTARICGSTQNATDQVCGGSPACPAANTAVTR